MGVPAVLMTSQPEALARTKRFPASSLAAAELPQRHPWQGVLRTYLASLKPTDFVIADTNWQFVVAYKATDHEKLYRDWIAMKGGSRLPASVQPYAARWSWQSSTPGSIAVW